MKYFTLKELTHSDTAVGLHIDNTPTEVHVENLTALVDDVLDPIRTHWGLPIRVSSGYRCPELNDEVGGVEESYHMDGCAADITALDPVRNMELMALIRTLHLTGRLYLTECYFGPGCKYIHVAYSKQNIDPHPFF